MRDTIYRYTIYGERHSGTKFLKNIIDAHFNLEVTWEYGWKHFFGFYKDALYRNVTDTIFLCIVRNPYDWLQAMYNQPHHINGWYSNSNNSIQNPFNSMRLFLKSEIRSYNTPNIISDDYKKYFQENIHDRNLLTGKPYKNIFELRKLKLFYLYRLKDIAPHIVLIKYEDLLKDYMSFVRHVSITENIPIKENRRVVGVAKKNSYDIDISIKNLINTNIDWDTEAKFGYTKK